MPGFESFLSAAGSALTGLGGFITNAQNANQAEQNRRFQERMANTSYQRAVADMRKAGLNPALAYQRGGADTPSGAQAQMQDPSAGVSNAYNTLATNAAQRRQMDAQTKLTEAETTQLRLESAERLADLQARIRLQDSNAATNTFRNALMSHQSEATALGNLFAKRTFDIRAKQLQADYDSTLSNARERNATALLQELNAPGARNRADAESSFFKKYFAPYLNDAETLSRIGGTVLRDLIPQFRSAGTRR